MDGTCRTGKIKYPVNLKQDGLRHIVGDKFETGIGKQMNNISFYPSKKIVKAQDVMTIRNEPLHIGGSL